MQISITVILSGITVIVVITFILRPCAGCPAYGDHIVSEKSAASQPEVGARGVGRGGASRAWGGASRTGRSPDCVWWRFSEALRLFERNPKRLSHRMQGTLRLFKQMLQITLKHMKI